MLKKIFAIGFASLLLLPAACFADGFYAGAGVGYDAAKFNTNLNATVDGTIVSIPGTGNFSGNGVLGSMFAGYGWSFNNFYVGTELDLAISSLNSTNKQPNLPADGDAILNRTDKDSIDKNISISVLPGYKLTSNTMVYGRLAYVRAHMDSDIETTQNSNPPTVISGSNGLNGIRYGVGLETDITKNIGLRAEYNHTNYQTVSISTTLAGPIYVKANVQPSTNEGEISAFYRFG
jgi:outer membrane autotransporter protein